MVSEFENSSWICSRVSKRLWMLLLGHFLFLVRSVWNFDINYCVHTYVLDDHALSATDSVVDFRSERLLVNVYGDYAPQKLIFES